MGDHRARCDIVFEIHEKKYELHLDFVNWFCPNSDGLDTRVARFFEESWSDAMDRFAVKTAKWRAQDQEQSERMELARLKAKYERR